MQCPKCLSNMEIKLVLSHLWKKFQNKIVHQRTFTNKTFFVRAPCDRYHDIIYLLQNPKLQRNAMGFINHN